MNVLIVGFGGIGCRHGQSLLSAKEFEKIYIVEPSDQKFAEGLVKIGTNTESFFRVPSVYDLDCSNIKIAVIATSSEPRFQIMKHLIESGIKFFLVEKIVFQSITQFNSIIKLVERNGVKAYCNFVNRYFKNYIELKKKIKALTSTVSINVVAGNLGLGCTAIHYMDLFEYLTGNSISECSSILSPWKTNSKRGSNYMEFSGILHAKDNNNNMLTIYFDPSHTGSVNLLLKIDSEQMLLSEGCETEYYFNRQIVEKRTFDIIPTSRLTGIILKDILSHSTFLPTIADTKNAHSLLFKQINQTLGLPDEEEVLCQIT